MRLNILIGGKAGQGINKVSEIVSQVLAKHGYFTFDYREYPSLIRGGHNFNVLSISDERVGSTESKLDGIVFLDENTLKKHEQNLKKTGFKIGFSDLKQDFGKNLNIALAGALICMLGIDKKILIEEVEKTLGKEAAKAAETGFCGFNPKFKLPKLNNKVKIMTGSKAIAEGARNSDIDLYLAYPMTPATGVMLELAEKQVENKLMVFQPENEIAVANMALGASFAGAKTMIGSSGGGFDLMTEALSLQGQTEIPLVVYLASRPGPSTGIPTYTAQADLDVALKGGHGEFPRIVIAPGDPIECIEKTNEAFYLSEKFNCLSIILSDKLLAESEFSFDNFNNIHKPLKVEVKRKLPGEAIVKANSYEHDKYGNTSETAETAKENAEERLKKYEEIKKQVKNFEMIKIFGKKESKNLVIGWGSSKTAILDAIKGLDYKFLQVIYMKPLSDEIKKHIEAAKKVIIVEQNVTGQLGRLIREKTGISIKHRILKYDARPFESDKLKEEIERVR